MDKDIMTRKEIRESITNPMDNMVKKPFVTYTLDEDKEQDPKVEVISLKLNKEERALIEELKRYTNYGQDAKVIKLGLAVLKKSILATFGAELFSKLTSNDRRKPIFENDTKKEN